MASNKTFKFGPVALTTTLTTNILNPNVTSLAGPVGFTMTQPYIILRHIRIVNKTGGAVCGCTARCRMFTTEKPEKSNWLRGANACKASRNARASR